MPRHPNFEPKGVIPACILPFHEDLKIDERAYRQHLRHTADVHGVSAITVNAHATEVASCRWGIGSACLYAVRGGPSGRLSCCLTRRAYGLQSLD
ncbi:hypothetical protein PMI06_006702 [Burkholderia sp. BT03]|nr:hypothetical protein PMI06_006702 [Burkholderia sp. BT03]SKC93712.1 hypothetical protein SAMN06266956_5722 [Paraburkholderia hospita]